MNFVYFFHHIFLLFSLSSHASYQLHRQGRVKDQGDSRGDRMFDPGGQWNVAKLHGTCRDFNGYIGCYYAMHSSDMLCHAGGEFEFEGFNFSTKYSASKSLLTVSMIPSLVLPSKGKKLSNEIHELSRACHSTLSDSSCFFIIIKFVFGEIIHEYKYFHAELWCYKHPSAERVGCWYGACLHIALLPLLNGSA